MNKLKNMFKNAITSATSSSEVDDEEIEKIIDSEESLRSNRKIYTLRLTTNELIHLRDLFGIKMPAMLDTTLSQALAKREERQYTEARLWNKIGTACEAANIALNEESPEFTFAIAGMPEIRLVELSALPIDNNQYQCDEEDEECSDNEEDEEDDADENNG